METNNVILKTNDGRETSIAFQDDGDTSLTVMVCSNVEDWKETCTYVTFVKENGVWRVQES